MSISLGICLILFQVPTVFGQAPKCRDLFLDSWRKPVAEGFSSLAAERIARPATERLNEMLQDPSYKVIVLARHGKASQENKFLSAERAADPYKVELDVARPLSKKGRRAADQIAELMGELEFRDVGMWGSYAQRVQETAKRTKKELGKRVKIYELEKELYYADVTAEMKRRLVTESGEALPHAFFWGHGKSTMAFFKDLTGTTDGFLPTSGVVIVALKAESWAQVFDGKASQVESFFWSPKNTLVIEGSKAPVSYLEHE